MGDIGPVAAEICHDRVARLRMLPHFARQGQETPSGFEVDCRNVDSFGNALAFRFFAVAQLDIGTEASRPKRDALAAVRVNTKFTRFGPVRLTVLGTKLARVFALGVVRAANKRAVTAELE